MYLRERMTELDGMRYLEPPSLALHESLIMAIGHIGLCGDVVEEGIQPTGGYDGGIELLECAASCITWVGKERESCLTTLCINPIKLGEGKEYLPTYLQFTRITLAL